MGARLSRAAAALLVVGIALPGLFLRLDRYPAPWFDEGYKLNAAYTLATRGVYGTHTTAGDLPFDPGISAGPVLVVPVALSFRLFGVDLGTARLVVALFCIVALIGLCATARHLYGERAGPFVALVALLPASLPALGVISLGRQVLGEVPGLAFALIGINLCFLAWRRERFDLAALAGAACGLALLGKLQFACALIPALAVVGAARWWVAGSRLATSMAPLTVCVAVAAGWAALEIGLPPAAVRADNAVMLADVFHTGVFTGTWGARLSSRSLALAALMTAIAMVRAPAVLSAIRRRDQRGWDEGILVVAVLAHTAWFVLGSIGWPRYAFAGFAFASLLAGKIVWDGCAVVARRQHTERERWYRAALATVAAAALLLNLAPSLLFAGDGGAHEMAHFIARTVPPRARIETWEWEMDVLSRREFHHPHQRFLFLAMRRIFLEPAENLASDPLRLGYQPLQADPDYLVLGPVGEWTRVYDQMRDQDFRRVAVFGRYSLFERVRDGDGTGNGARR